MLDADIIAKRLPSGETLLQDIQLSAAPGDIVALLGPSGTGKTTTLRILLGLDQNFDGRVASNARRTAAMLQEPLLLPWCTIAENITLVVPKATKPPDVTELLEDVGLPDADKLYPRQISLGMARRVAFARALAIEPDLMLLDEPFASLDPGTAGTMADLLVRHVRTRRATVIMAMHDVDRAVAIATRIVVLSGRPATVAMHIEIPASATKVTRVGIRNRLISDFAFLAHPPSLDRLFTAAVPRV